MIFSFHIYSGEVKAGLVKNNIVLPQTAWNIVIPLFNFQILCYLAASIRIINNYRKELKDIYSAIEAINLSWLKLILYAFILMWIIDVLHFVFLRLIRLPPVLSELMSLISLSINFVFALILILKALKYPELFFEMEKKKAKVKYEGSLLTKEESENYLKKLTAFMKIEKPYLIPSLTINTLAGKISLPGKILSQVINENLHQNFFDFINSYRIERAKELLGEPGNRKNILEIVYETGFNSKSVFNTAFKKHTGITPSQYKRQVQKSVLSNKVA